MISTAAKDRYRKGVTAHQTDCIHKFPQIVYKSSAVVRIKPRGLLTEHVLKLLGKSRHQVVVEVQRSAPAKERFPITACEGCASDRGDTECVWLCDCGQLLLKMAATLLTACAAIEHRSHRAGNRNCIHWDGDRHILEVHILTASHLARGIHDSGNQLCLCRRRQDSHRPHPEPTVAA